MAAVALLNANGTRKMSVKSPNQTQQGQTVTVELDISDAYGTEFLVAVYDYANNVTTYRVEMDLGTMEREYFTAIDYNTMTYVGVDRAGQTSFLAETGLPLLARAAEYVGGHVFVITTDNSLCVADDENLSFTERICQLDPNRERLITGVNDLAYNHAVGRLYVQYYSELNREARPFLAAIDMDDGGLQHICELPVDVNTMAIDVAGGSKACYELGTFADGVWPVADLMEPGEVQNHIGVIMPDQALATTSVPMNTATPPVTEPSCTEPGYTTYTCSCGESYVADHTDPLGHDWHGTDCSRCDEKRENPFVDVPNDSFYIDPVLWAVEKEITTDMDATHFGPGLACNRAQVVTFLWRSLAE